MTDITPTPIHNRPLPYLRECKSGLKFFVLIIFSCCDSVPKCVKVRNNFFCSLTHDNRPWSPPRNFSYHENIWTCSFIMEILSIRRGSAEVLTFPRVVTENLPYTYDLSYPTYLQKIKTYIISSSTQWHTFIDTHRHRQSHPQPLIRAKTHMLVYSDTCIYMQIYPLSTQSHKDISLSFSYIHTNTCSKTAKCPLVVMLRGYLSWQTEVGVKWVSRQMPVRR